MRNRVYSVSIHNFPDDHGALIYRCNGTTHGGAVRWYELDTERTIRLLRAMVATSTRKPCYVHYGPGISHWVISGLVNELYARRRELEAAS